jgi:hypothetical protein
MGMMDHVSTRTPRRDTLVDREESTAKVPAYALSLARNLARSSDTLQSLPYPVRRSGLHAVVPPPAVRRRPVPLLVPHEDDDYDDDDEPTSIRAPSVRLIAHSVPCVADLDTPDDDDDTDTDIGIEHTLRMASAPGPVAAPFASGVVSVEMFAAPPAQAEEPPLPTLEPFADPEPTDERQYEPRAQVRSEDEETLAPVAPIAPLPLARELRSEIITQSEIETKSEVKSDIQVQVEAKMAEVVPILEPFPDVPPFRDLSATEEPANEELAELPAIPAGLEPRRPASAFYWVASVAAVIGGCALTAALTHAPVQARAPHVLSPDHVTSCLAELARPAAPPVVSTPVVKRGLAVKAARPVSLRARLAAEPTGIVRDLPY